MERFMKTVSDYGPKLVLFIGLAFSTYMRFIIMENDVVDIHDRLDKKIIVINQDRKRIYELEKIIYHLEKEIEELKSKK